MLRYLLDNGAEVNLLDNERHSVVHWATVCGELDSLDVVLDAGAEASVEDIHGAFPIHYAAQMCGHSSSKKGSVPSASRYAGLSALKKLINHGVPVDVIDRDGRQPLLWAASSGMYTPFKIETIEIERVVLVVLILSVPMEGRWKSSKFGSAFFWRILPVVD